MLLLDSWLQFNHDKNTNTEMTAMSVYEYLFKHFNLYALYLSYENIYIYDKKCNNIIIGYKISCKLI